MKISRIENYSKGWVVGNFYPSEFHNPHVEVAVKFFKSGDSEESHYQITATEITVVHQGQINLANSEFGPGDVIVLEPGEVASFHSITDSTLTCIKFPSLPSDKVNVHD
jgi:hypothetical protein